MLLERGSWQAALGVGKVLALAQELELCEYLRAVVRRLSLVPYLLFVCFVLVVVDDELVLAQPAVVSDRRYRLLFVFVALQ